MAVLHILIFALILLVPCALIALVVVAVRRHLAHRTAASSASGVSEPTTADAPRSASTAASAPVPAQSEKAELWEDDDE